MLHYDKLLKRGMQISIPPRPAEDGLTESILKTGKPVFIPVNVFDYLTKMGISIPIWHNPPQPYLGIPIISEGKTWEFAKGIAM